MGAPLLIVGASAGKLLPKAGAWMDTVKKLFGVMMLAVAAWMLARIDPGRDRAAAVVGTRRHLPAWILCAESSRWQPRAGWPCAPPGCWHGLYGVMLADRRCRRQHRSAAAAEHAAASNAAAPDRHRSAGLRTIKSLDDLQQRSRRRPTPQASR